MLLLLFLGGEERCKGCIEERTAMQGKKRIGRELDTMVGL
jgi:hypothetical protein